MQQTITELERQLDAIRHIAVGLSSIASFDHLVRDALSICLECAGAEAGSILLYSQEKRRLIFAHVVGEKAHHLTGVEMEPDQGLAGLVFQTGETHITEDVSKEHAHYRGVGEMIGFVTTNMVTTPLKGGNGHSLGVMQVLNKVGAPFQRSDVTLIEIMAAHIAVAIENTRLHEQARLAAVMRFIGDISHDVKNMVTPAITGAETLRLVSQDCLQALDTQLAHCTCDTDIRAGLGTALDDLRALQPELLDIILESCNAVQQRMADISAAVKGVVSPPCFEVADIGPLARRVTGVLRAFAQQKGIALRIDIIGELPMAPFDAKQMYNAIYNLLFNALEACSSGDTVTLRLSGQAAGDFPEGNYLLLECEDTGPGITEPVKAKLFTDEAISTKPLGTGLGTRIVKNVIDAHQGTVALESVLGIGTRIRCRIPADRALVSCQPAITHIV
jgi:signal transduction histidine kinase